MDEARTGEAILPQQAATDEVILRWTVHPVIDRPGRTALLGVLCVPFLGLILLFFDIMHMVLGAGLLAVFLSGYFFPTTYELTESGVTIHSRLYRGTKSWTDFSRWHAYPDAVYLLHPEGGFRNRMVRGSLLLLKKNREQVLDVVRQQLGEPG